MQTRCMAWLARAFLVAATLNAPALAQKPAKPPVIADADALAERAKAELMVTKPDFIVFKPEIKNGEVSDTGNEHFLVFDGPDGSLMAVWTQSSAEAQPDQHITFSRSTDEGVTWSKPRIIAGPKKAGDGHMASWGYPLVSKSGRIYVLYSQHIGKHDSFFHHTGWLHGIHSDDNGATWSEPQNVPVARSVNDNPDLSFPPNMLCWQKPLRLGEDGKYFAGFTRWTSNAVSKNPTKSWTSHDARVEFMRFENVDDSPEVKDLKISWFAANDKALAVPFPGHPEVSACQEPSIVKLPDGRLFVVMRTASGSPFWSVSGDQGETWATPRRLLRKDGGDPLLHPLSPCPIYDVGGNTAGSGRYALFIHNNDGHYKNYGPTDTGFNRRPVYLAAGRFQAGADQPVWFDEPKLFMDHKGVGLGKPGTAGRQDLALYASFTVRKGKAVLWYPDRKFFLLGRIIGDEWFAPKGDEKQGNSSLAPPPVDTAPGPRFGDAARAFQGIPGIERAANGRLWAVWYAGGPDEPGEGPGNYVVLVNSGDDGKTWSGPRLVIDPPGPVRAYDPCLWHDPQGRLWLFWAQSYNWWDGRSGVWAIVAENSGDEAPRWSTPRRLCDGIMMNKPTVLSNGDWLLPAAVWSGPADPRTPPAHRHDLGDSRGANVVVSKDQGATWNAAGAGARPSAHLRRAHDRRAPGRRPLDARPHRVRHRRERIQGRRRNLDARPPFVHPPRQLAVLPPSSELGETAAGHPRAARQEVSIPPHRSTLRGRRRDLVRRPVDRRAARRLLPRRRSGAERHNLPDLRLRPHG